MEEKIMGFLEDALDKYLAKHLKINLYVEDHCEYLEAELELKGKVISHTDVSLWRIQPEEDGRM